MKIKIKIEAIKQVYPEKNALLAPILAVSSWESKYALSHTIDNHIERRLYMSGIMDGELNKLNNQFQDAVPTR